MYFKILRTHHWLKNLLIFLPVFAAGLFSIDYLILGLPGFIIFSLTASSIYIFNDIADIKKDKKHPTKKNRLIAQNKISINTALITSFILITCALVGAYFYNVLNFILIYILLNIFYTFFLKKIKIIDLVTLTSFYIIRIFYGGAFFDIEISLWLFIFSFFSFISLSTIKRLNEVKKYKKSVNIYIKSDENFLSTLSVTAGLLSVFVLIFYFQDSNVEIIVSNKILLWISFPLYFIWITLMNYLAINGKMNDDPLVHAIKDKTSLILIFLITFLIYLSQTMKASLF